MKLSEFIAKLTEMQTLVGGDVEIRIADYDKAYICQLSYVEICDIKTDPDDGPVRLH